MSDGKPIINITRGTVVCESAVLADRPLPRMRGLLGRESLPAGEGVLLHPAPSIHTAFMRFPIDAVFLDTESVVVRVVERLVPWRAAAAQRARSVLELRAGESARRGIQVGDWLVRVSEDLIWQDPADDRQPPSLVRATANVDHAATGMTQLPGGPRAETGLGWRELLLVSRDRRFRAVMAVLLHSRGFTVTFATSPEDSLVVARSRAEIVVIDADASLGGAQHAAEQAGLMSADRTVIFVRGDAVDAGAAGVVPKWESLERLCDDIAAARPGALRRARRDASGAVAREGGGD